MFRNAKLDYSKCLNLDKVRKGRFTRVLIWPSVRMLAGIDCDSLPEWLREDLDCFADTWPTSFGAGRL